jgi:trans-aconitate methyltransferase
LSVPQGAEGAWNPAHYDRSYSFVWKCGEEMVSLLDPKPGERVLDVGSGTGHLTADIARRGAEVTGIDSSAEMVGRARLTYPDLRFEVADAAEFRTSKPFDAVFSNAALHWMTEAEPIARSIAAALKPGGRFVAEFGGKGNVARFSRALGAVYGELVGSSLAGQLQLWYFPGIAEYATVLERAELELRYAVLFDRPTVLDGAENGLRDWIDMFLKSALKELPAESRARLVAGVEDRLRPELFRDGSWVMDYRRLRIMAVKTA